MHGFAYNPTLPGPPMSVTFTFISPSSSLEKTLRIGLQSSHPGSSVSTLDSSGTSSGHPRPLELPTMNIKSHSWKRKEMKRKKRGKKIERPFYFCCRHWMERKSTTYWWFFVFVDMSLSFRIAISNLFRKHIFCHDQKNKTPTYWTTGDKISRLRRSHLRVYET